MTKELGTEGKRHEEKYQWFDTSNYPYQDNDESDQNIH